MRYTAIALWVVAVLAWLSFALHDPSGLLAAIIVTGLAATCTFAEMARRDETRSADQ